MKLLYESHRIVVHVHGPGVNPEGRESWTGVCRLEIQPSGHVDVRQQARPGIVEELVEAGMIEERDEPEPGLYASARLLEEFRPALEALVGGGSEPPLRRW